MAASSIHFPSADRPPPPLPRRWGSVAGQAAAGLIIALILLWAGHNAATALADRNMRIDFSFLSSPAGFDIPFHLIPWSTSDSYGFALLVAALNTALAAALAIVLASALGLVIALFRLSPNPLASALARGVTELVRNTPQLLQIVFWYIAVLQILPGAKASLSIGTAVFLNVRGLFMPAPSSSFFVAGIGAGVLCAMALPRLFPRAPVLLTALMPCVLGAGFGAMLTPWELPALRGFNFQGGWRLPPELLALVIGIGIYTSAFIAENLRASIQAVAPGQREAARSLGLSTGRTMRLVVLPQALRTLLPPLTSHYLNIIKSTTLGAAIAYPEVLQIFARTVLNQTGRAVETMILVLSVFLATNVVVSGLIGSWNRRLQRSPR